MRKLLVPVLSALLMGATVTTTLAQDKTAATAQQPGPRFKFETGETHDFGVVKRGPVAMHTFEFTNVGTEPIIVMNVTPSCGCTNVEWSKNPVLPGQKGFIQLGLKTEEQHGVFHKEVYIQSNAITPHGEKRYTLYIKGNAKDDVTEEDLKKNEKATKGKKKKK
ncbi:hypothetical protein GCM10023093_26820 [Nemorincola caseinilytica]|uniref:DUF1573 domain-containing protein n=1 Tax=Nemorincola caseinilytica TaxID=2054315 RepID=A0ABP8NK99_9BACT